MKTVGIIAEYNPFHKGHKYHIEETRWQTGCRYVVVVMSGEFTQRGEPALLDKWTRTRMALLEGADIVLELPALFAVRSADSFAAGGVGMLSALDVVDGISFGCETDDLPTLKFVSDTFEEEPAEVSRAIKKGLREGKSLARARGEALSAYMQIDPAILNAPNTALAIEYIRANARLEKPMHVTAVKRKGEYHSEALGEFASASAIRMAVREGKWEEALACMPDSAAQLLRETPAERLADPSGLDNLLLYALRCMSKEQLRDIWDVTEGLEDRLLRLAQTAPTRQDLLEALKCKRYTMARLSRVLANVLLGVDNEIAARYACPPYARLLGFRESARLLLREMSEKSHIPLVSDVTQIRDNPCFRIERRATDLRSLCTADPVSRAAGRDFTSRMQVLRDIDFED